MEKNNLFFGGIPTEPDVIRLTEEYPVGTLKPGYVIHYRDITQIIKEKPTSSRFRTVTNAWRKKMEVDYNLIIGPPTVPNETFIVYTDPEKVGLQFRKLRQSVKCAKRSVAIGTVVDIRELSDKEKAKFDYTTAKAGAVIACGLLRSGTKSVPEV